MKPYKLSVVYELIEFIMRQDRRSRRVIQQAFDSLREFPHNGKNLAEKDESGREYFVNFRGDFAVKYWIDEPEREVKVIDIKPRERR